LSVYCQIFEISTDYVRHRPLNVMCNTGRRPVVSIHVELLKSSKSRSCRQPNFWNRLKLGMKSAFVSFPVEELAEVEHVLAFDKH